jgi:O-antigen ligase
VITPDFSSQKAVRHYNLWTIGGSEGSVHIKGIVDVLVFIPLIPAIPVIATWFLPWERWIPKRIPKKIIGPYLLYCAFALWYFKQSLVDGPNGGARCNCSLGYRDI